MHTRKRLLIATVFALLPALAAADVVVSHFEPLRDTQVSASSLRFAAMGRGFELQLVNNERILAGLGVVDRSTNIAVYRGRLTNHPNSWARIVVYDGMPRGIIWDGAEMFVIEAPDDSALSVSTPVIYRLADAFITPGTMSCDSDKLVGDAAVVLKNLSAANKAAVTAAPGAVSEITLSVIGDYEFTDNRGGNSAAAAAITTRMNNVDGFFSEQVGVQINVQFIETNSDPMDPFGDTLTSDVLLDELSEYRLQTPAHNVHGLTHLFTGRNLEASTVGVAWQDALCDDYFGTGLTEGRGGALNDSLVAAHEIGHNFGAEHDGEAGSACAADTGAFIMSPTINGSQQFSACSVAIMQASAAAASCVVALPRVDVSIEPQGHPRNVLLGASTDFVYRVASNGTLNASAVVADITVPSTLFINDTTVTSGNCSSGAGTVSCDLGVIAGLAAQTITITASATSVGSGQMNASVSTSGTDERPGNNQSSSQVTVDPAVNLAISGLTTSAVFVDATTTVSAQVSNLSDLAATNVVLSISLESGLRAESATWSLGTCSVAAQQVDCAANTIPAQQISTLSFTATGVTAGARDVAVTLTSTEPDADSSDNNALAEVQVVAQRKPDKDSGGGATNPFGLLLLTFAMAIRRRR